MARQSRGSEWVIAGFLLVAVLLAGAAGLVVWQVAFSQRQAAVSAQLRAEQAAAIAFQTQMLASVDVESNTRELTTRATLARASEQLEQQSMPPREEASIRLTIGLSLEQLGEYKQADEHLARALQLFEQASGPENERTVEARTALERVRSATATGDG